MSEQAQTFTIATIPADGVGREVVEAGQRVLDCVAGQSGGKLAFAGKSPVGMRVLRQNRPHDG